ncbi:hypothetical protein Lepto7376_0416 [[Leptolyngbya] sp. PCC 7376]|uniref:hypothetical protein n=1 Tax=[Leptolyngbya] sp. PCC 7376 TaxID=111781 RepID=UPI00029F46A0|nr:hypothetical protein [[Leptolyngbya] sp. PCC 7376]AFY36851.1 hypothetical protein Lepto7376_0416 [[Leptolyngbya] sp. PCC 7376]
MKIIWHDASINGISFDVESSELKLFIEFNASLGDELLTSPDEFVAGVCLFRNVQGTQEIKELCKQFSENEKIFGDVLSCETIQKDVLSTTVLKFILFNLDSKTQEFVVLEIDSEPYKFQVLG